MTGATKPGEIRAVGLGRRFELRTGGPRSVKDVILRRSRTDRREFWALRNIDLRISPGETFGLVGRNGSGKSTLLNLIARIYAPTEGTLEVGGRSGALLEVGAGFHPEFTGTENVYLSGAIHGLSHKYIDAHLEEIICFAELERFAHMPVRTYSSGMVLRLGFSVAVHVQPEILLIDEILAVGDAAFQQKCFAKIWEFKRTGGSIVFVSHDPTTVSSLCDRAALLEGGRITALGKADEVLRTYQQTVIEGSPTSVELTTSGAPPGRFEIDDVRATATDGSRRDHFAENERITIQANVSSRETLFNGCVSMTLRDLSGRVIGAETLRGVRLEAGKAECISWILDQAPLREGRFLVDVRLATERSEAELATREAAVDFSIVSDSSDDGGPVRLGGEWQVAGRVVPRPRTAALGLRLAIVVPRGVEIHGCDAYSLRCTTSPRLPLIHRLKWIGKVRRLAACFSFFGHLPSRFGRNLPSTGSVSLRSPGIHSMCCSRSSTSPRVSERPPIGWTAREGTRLRFAAPIRAAALFERTPSARAPRRSSVSPQHGGKPTAQRAFATRISFATHLPSSRTFERSSQFHRPARSRTPSSSTPSRGSARLRGISTSGEASRVFGVTCYRRKRPQRWRRHINDASQFSATTRTQTQA